MRIGFYIFILFQRLISLLPFRLIYVFSDFLYFILYYIIGYRKEVVFTNLRNSFPNKSEIELKKIRRKYFRSLTDLILETIKCSHASSEQLSKRLKFKNGEVITDLVKANKSAFIMLGHTGNWELSGIVFPLIFNIKVFSIYQQQSNPYFDAYIKKLRGRFGAVPVVAQQSFRKFVEHKNEVTFNMVVGDQAPPESGDHYWCNFLNQETAFFTGTEKMAKTLNFAVVFASISRTKRGYYEIEFKLITDNPKETKENEITDKYVRNLEQFIIKNPDNWLWSHRRWKRKRINN